ncbi:MAG: TetR/AcrR family transcriptional regulator [Xanthomonadales bacterium]|jgi:AcrR family transcriptional regulator|nr:TetR/AcrR family transcriptional regulator [Xanthomonadales bacterium]
MSDDPFNLIASALSQRDPVVIKSERTRQAILEAALTFLWSRPFRVMTVRQLMAMTEVSRPAFYQYFQDLQQLMEALLGMLATEILAACEPWITNTGDPVVLVRESLTGLVSVCHRRGPFVKAIADAATTDERLERAWLAFVQQFDDTVDKRIRMDQELKLTAEFDPRPAAHSLNMLNAYTFISKFGRHPRSDPEPVRQALIRIWVSTLYGSRWAESECSQLERIR